MADWRGESGPTERPDLYRSCFHSRNEILPFGIDVHANDIDVKSSRKDGCAQSYLADKGRITVLEANNEMTTSLEGYRTNKL